MVHRAPIWVNRHLNSVLCHGTLWIHTKDVEAGLADLLREQLHPAAPPLVQTLTRKYRVQLSRCEPGARAATHAGTNAFALAKATAPSKVTDARRAEASPCQVAIHGGARRSPGG